MFIENNMSPDEIARQLEWALADPEQRIFADSHRRYALEIICMAAMALDKGTASRLRQQEFQRRGVRVLRTLKSTRAALAAGWIRPRDKALMPKRKGEDFQSFSLEPPHCLLSACVAGDSIGDPMQLAQALGFKDTMSLSGWEDMQTEARILEMLDRVVAQYEN